MYSADFKRLVVILLNCVSCIICRANVTTYNLGSLSIYHYSSTLRNADTVNYWQYRLSAGPSIFSPGVLDPIPGPGYSYDFIQSNTKITSSPLHNSRGLILRNSFVYNLKENPISPIIDFSCHRGNFNMIVYDQSGNEISHSWFEKLYLFDIGVGGELSGRYFNASLRYRYGLISGGQHTQTIPIYPLIIKNNKLNLISNVSHGLELSAGMKYKRFNLSIYRYIPLSKSIFLDNGLTTGLLAASLELGYSFKIGK